MSTVILTAFSGIHSSDGQNAIASSGTMGKSWGFLPANCCRMSIISFLGYRLPLVWELLRNENISMAIETWTRNVPFWSHRSCYNSLRMIIKSIYLWLNGMWAISMPDHGYHYKPQHSGQQWYALSFWSLKRGLYIFLSPKIIQVR